MTGARSSDPLRAGLAAWLREHDDDALVDEVAPDYLRRRLSSLVLSLGAPSAPTMTTGAGVGSGPGDEPARPRARDDAQPPAAPVVPVPVEAAAVSPGSPAVASSSQGARTARASSNAGAAAKAAFGARRREQIRAFVVAHGPVSSTQVAEHLGGGHTTAAEHLRALAAEGAIARGTNGGAPWSTRYAATQAQADAAARAARPGNRTLAEARLLLPGQGAEAPEEAVAAASEDDERRPLGAAAVGCAAAAPPPTVSDAARRAAIAARVSVPAPSSARGPLTEPPKRPRGAK